MNTNRTDIHKAFLQLVRIGIGTSKDAKIPHEIDWPAVKDLAERQGLGAVVLDGFEVLRTNGNLSANHNLPDKLFMLEWIGETLQGYEYRFVLYCRAIAELASFYNAHGYKMMVLKGYACSIDWPKPEHWPCGDIDIWLFGDYKKADASLSSEKGIKIDDSHERHTVFYWHDFMVENHYAFIDVHHRKSSPLLEEIFKEQGLDDTHCVELNDESSGLPTKIYLPSPNLHALFLLRHCMEHFASTELNLSKTFPIGCTIHSLDLAFSLSS